MYCTQIILMLFLAANTIGKGLTKDVSIPRLSCNNTTLNESGEMSSYSRKWKITFKMERNKSFTKENLVIVSQRFTEERVARTYKVLKVRAIVAISIYGVWGFIVIIGTIIDVISQKVVKCHKSTVTKASPMVQAVESPECSQNRDIGMDSCSDDTLVDLRKKKRRCLLLKDFMRRFVLCFSLYTNGSKLFNTSQGSGTLRSVDGIRFLSLTWVISGHTLMWSQSEADNPARMTEWVLKRWTYQSMENATSSVDSFFTISGLLVSYLTMRELSKAKGKINWCMYYFHRYFRLTVPLGMVMLFFIPIFEYLSSGPEWEPDTSLCEMNWWKTIFYVSNLDFDNKGQCIDVTWYTSNIMQFYILSPLILIPLYFRPRLGILVWGVFLFTTVLTTALITRLDYIGANPYQRSLADAYKVYYVKPYTRIGPYLIGLLAGYILHRTGNQLKLTWYISALIWSVTISTGLAVIYGLVESDQLKIILPWDVSALYNALSRTVWGLAVAWVVISCTTGNGGFINTLLSWQPFVFVSRLSYMTYLCHEEYTVQWFFLSLYRAVHVTDIGMVYRCLGSIATAFLVGFVASLVIELPVLNIETLIFKRERRK